jgi:NTF2-related export protein 1/2
MTSVTVDKKSRIDDACKTAEEFVNIFYEKMDLKRQTIGKMFLETATLAWNGNKIDGERIIFYLCIGNS